MARSVYRDWLARHRHAPPVSPVSRESDAILACAVGLDPEEVAPFVRSLRAVFSGQVILLVDRRPMLPAWLSTHGVETQLSSDRRLRWKPHSAISRFAGFARILQQRPEVQRVILADVRDVVFQSDPFHQAPADLHFYTDDSGAPANGIARAQLAENLAGARLARTLDGKARIASELIAGPTAAVIHFCRALLLLCDTARSGTAAGIDQAACHVVAHLGLAGGDVRPNFERVATACDGMTIADGRVSNPDGSISPIIISSCCSRDVADHVNQCWGLTAARGSSECAFSRTLRVLQQLAGGSPPQAQDSAP